ERRGAEMFHRLERRVESYPFVPTDPARLDQRCAEVFHILTTSLARRLVALPDTGRRMVLGVSGGQDSTLALLVAAHALDLLEIRRRPHVALRGERGRAEDARVGADRLGCAPRVRRRGGDGGDAAGRARDADQPGALAARRKRRVGGDRGHPRTVRAARLLPLLVPALRLRPAPHRAPRPARVRRPLSARGDPRAPRALPRALLRKSVQTRLRAGLAEGRLGRVAVAARRLAHARRCVGRSLAGRGALDPRLTGRE